MSQGGRRSPQGRGHHHLRTGFGKLLRPGGGASATRPTTNLGSPLADSGKPTTPVSTLISHLQRTEEESTAISYCKFLNLELDGHAVRAMLDSGNTWINAISRRLCRRLGISVKGLQPLPNSKLGTAKEGDHLVILGEVPQAIQLRVKGVGPIFPFRPIVIDHLAMDVNLPGPWLKQNRWDKVHSSDSLSIQGKLVRLHRQAANEQFTGGTAAMYFADEDVPIPAGTWKAVPLTVADAAPPFQEGTYYLRGEEAFMESTDLHPGLNALVTLRASGKAGAAVLNTTSGDISVPRGTRYGQAEPAQALDQTSRGPGLNHFGKSHSHAKRMAKDAKAASKAAKGQQVLLGKAARDCSRPERIEWFKKRIGTISPIRHDQDTKKIKHPSQ